MKKTLIVLLVALFACTFAFAQGATEAAPAASSNEPMTITMLYAATATEVGPIPEDWEGFAIIREKLGINLVLQQLPSAAADQDLVVQTMAAADELPDFITVPSKKVYDDLVAKGFFADVTDDFAKMPERSETLCFQSNPQGSMTGSIVLPILAMKEFSAWVLRSSCVGK